MCARGARGLECRCCSVLGWWWWFSGESGEVYNKFGGCGGGASEGPRARVKRSEGWHVQSAAYVAASLSPSAVLTYGHISLIQRNLRVKPHLGGTSSSCQYCRGEVESLNLCAARLRLCCRWSTSRHGSRPSGAYERGFMQYRSRGIVQPFSR